MKKIFGETLADEVLKNADKAYKTAGLSANQYLDTVTSFSATLIAGLGDDTSKAAKYADMAIRNMSDNANTFGTDMSSIQNAYQGFAKQNYTMLDNLKLGYGGTAAEMARLINESGVLGDSVEVTAKTVKDVPFDQVIRAIDRTQKRMGIAGTTAKEAASTIEGATGSMSAAWKNMVRGLADENSDFSVLTQNWLNTLISPDGKGGMIGTMLPRITQVVKGIGSALQTSVPMILDAVIPLIKEHLPQIVGAAQEAVKAAADVLPAIMPIVAEVVPQIVTMLLSTLPDLAASGVELMKAIMQGIIDGIPLLLEMLPDIARVGVEMVVSIVNGITEAIPDLIEMLPGIISTVVDVLIENLPAVIDAGVALLLALVDGLDVALPMLIDMLPDIVTKISVALVENADKLLEGAVQLFFALVTGLLENIPALIEALGEVVETVISNLTEPLNTLFVNFWNTVTTAASNAWASIKEAWRGAISWFRDNITSPIGRVFSASWDALKKGASDAWEGIKNVFKSVADWFGNIFSKAWQKVKDVFSTGGKIFDGIKEGIVTAFKAVVNGIIGGINKVIALPFNAINGLLNKIRSIDILGFEPFALLWKENPLAVPQIPLLARGGVLRRGQVGVLEGTGAEAVVPLEHNTEWIQRVADEMRNAFDGVTNTGNMVEAFKEALSDMKIELDDEVAGRFVRRTVTRIIYN
ncbi:MAG: hypothetical protein IKO68_08230 [Oscillospiraceae bacterium]|nr:hypothetical protein [Oscillospiraceae bacterium]